MTEERREDSVDPSAAGSAMPAGGTISREAASTDLMLKSELMLKYRRTAIIDALIDALTSNSAIEELSEKMSISILRAGEGKDAWKMSDLAKIVIGRVIAIVQRMEKL